MGLEIFILVIYGLALLFIFLYSLVQLQLVIYYNRKKKRNHGHDKTKPALQQELEFVTVQLPVYNEKYVVERLLHSISNFDYPKDKFEIQILDDSDDETSEIIANQMHDFRKLGFDIHHIQREKRDGFKAGALAAGLKTAKGYFIAIFDSDFMPGKDFLRKSMPYFSDHQIGMVQSKWTHVNENYSWLTKLQAFGLDAHFSVEQSGRNEGGHFINFNGTAGIWRKQCIVDSGGWQADTLTEDLDLSYRAQIKGWKFKFLEELGSPAELPAEMNALKTQQYRWTKGAAECSRKNLFNLLRSKDFSFNTKLNATFHLLNSSVFICIVIVSVLSLPVLFIKHNFIQYQWLFKLAGIFLFGFLFLAIFYYTAFRSKMNGSIKSLVKFLVQFPMFVSVSMGLSLHNGLAAFEGLIGRKTAFIRTPKFNIIEQSDSWKSNKYFSGKVGKLAYAELILAFYFLAGLIVSIKFDDYGLFPFLLMLTTGYFYVSFLSLKHALSR